MVWATQLVFYGLPWLEWHGRQAVLFDLGARRFYIFGLVLYPQDFIYLTGLLIISAYALFLFTAVAGRLWCGYACPQTVYTEIFMWVERHLEGDRMRRMKLDRGGGVTLERRKAAAQRRQATGLAGHRAVDGLHLRRLLHAHPHLGSFGADPGIRPLGMVLGAVLQPGHLRQRRLDARAGRASTCALTRASRARCSTRTR